MLTMRGPTLHEMMILKTRMRVLAVLLSKMRVVLATRDDFLIQQTYKYIRL